MENNSEIVEYDIVIVGAGPSGLSTAQCCSHKTKKILIIDREEDIGGCHRVRRVDVGGEKVFTEHGPRVYSDTYVNTIQLLKEMGLNFYDLFVKYNFSLADIGGKNVFFQLTFCEKLRMFKEFLLLLLNGNHGKNTTMKEYVLCNSFRQQSIDVIDRVCRLTDGATLEKYTLNQFLELLNTQFFYSLYQPRSPNDIGLFKLWRNYLESRGVEFRLTTSVTNVFEKDGIIEAIELKNRDNKDKPIIVKAQKFILAIPPRDLYKVVSLSSSDKINNSFGSTSSLSTYSEETSYIDYICMTFHWDKKLNLPKVYGFPKSYWGVGFIVLSDYMNFKESVSQTVISIIITIPENTSPHINKTANECSKEELFDEVIRQLRESFPEIESPTVKLLSPSMIYHETKNKWINLDTAFISTANFPYLNFTSSIKNLYTVGTHTGKQFYKFTSMESAVSNGIGLSLFLYPELNSIYKIKKSVGIRDIFLKTLLIMFFIIFVIVIFKTMNKRYKRNV